MRDTRTVNTEARPAHTVTRHDDRGRYELVIDGDVVAFADFSQRDDVITIPYVETDVRHRGNGYSSLLMDRMIDDMRRCDVLARPTCPVARVHFAANAPDLLVH